MILSTTITFNAVAKSEAEVLAMMLERRALGFEMFVADLDGVVGYASYAQFRAGIGYARSMEPVSYTHLDVYKRQSITCRAMCSRRGWRIWRFRRSP